MMAPYAAQPSEAAGVSAELSQVVARLRRAAKADVSPANGSATAQRHGMDVNLVLDELERLQAKLTPNAGEVRLEKRLSLVLYRSLERLSIAIEECGKIGFQDSKPATDEHHASIWLDLNEAQKDAKLKLKHFALAASTPAGACEHESASGVVCDLQVGHVGQHQYHSSTGLAASWPNAGAAKEAGGEGRGAQNAASEILRRLGDRNIVIRDAYGHAAPVMTPEELALIISERAAPNRETELREALESEVKRLRHDGEHSHASVGALYGRWADRIEAILAPDKPQPPSEGK